jgi:pimeloyl-ACP methyl ester carboxylesterase
MPTMRRDDGVVSADPPVNRQSDLSQAGRPVMADTAPSPVVGSRGHTHNNAPTRFVEVDGVRFAYRRFGNPVGTPVVLLQHFMGNLDNYDPAITDALALGREVILTDNAGVGLSTGAAPETVAGMARDAASLIDALSLEEVDLFGFSIIVVATVNSFILQQNLPDAELVIFPDSNHGSHLQFTQRFNRYVIDFLDR